MKSIAIIPARGGSKRIPRKNVVPFRGRPMIGWTIQAALSSGLFDIVLVSTDDPEIAAIGRAEGAEAPFLRSAHADDHSPVSDAIIATLEQAEAHYNAQFNTVAQLMPNCPLRGADEIHAAWEKFHAGLHRFQISAFQFGWMNPWWAARLAPDGTPDWVFPDARVERSQDLDTLYCPSGAIWLAETAALKAYRTFYGPGHVLCSMPWHTAIDIDDWDDFQMAEALAYITHADSSEAQGS